MFGRKTGTQKNSKLYINWCYCRS